MSAADALVRRLPRVTLVAGKGGVGKTTAAAALALHSSRIIGPTLVLTTDPARALPTVLGSEITSDATGVPYAPRLQARVLNAAPLRARFMERWGVVIRLILDRGTYLDAEDIGPLVDTALPGSDEVFAALALAELLGERGEERIVVDTAPTGHTLRLLSLPRTFRALVRLLDAMQGKHRYMVKTLTRRYRRDDADAFIEEMTRLVAALEATLRDTAQCAAVMIAQPAPMVREETERYLAALAELHVSVAALVWNAVDVPGEPLGDVEQLMVPRLASAPVGERGLSLWIEQLAPGDARTASSSPRTQHPIPNTPPAPTVQGFRSVLRPLTIVAGKGGVGKTTVAAALALHSARDARTLVVSTDPAPSLADAFAQKIPDADTPIAAASNLVARQMDASAAFARLRRDYQERVDAVFDGLVGRGVDLAADRGIVRELLSLAPPGIDEVYALTLIADAMFREEFQRVIVDPAPTGHLLRLLEMPALALAWSHQLLRLMLKYREVTALGDAAADVLAFARDLRGIDALLRDPARAGVVIVTFGQPVVTEETDRLAREIRRLGVAISGVVVNRTSLDGIGDALPVREAPVHFEAPLASDSPIGVAALEAWSANWRER